MQTNSREKFIYILVMIMFGTMLSGCFQTLLPTASTLPTTTLSPLPSQTPQAKIAMPTVIPEVTVIPKATSTFTPTPVIKPDSPTPVLIERTNIIEVNWTKPLAADHPGWINNTTAVLAVYNDHSGEGYITADISNGKSAIVNEGPAQTDLRVYSPRKTFVIECGKEMKLFRVKDSALVSKTALPWPSNSWVTCSSVVQWAPDESGVSYVDENHLVYIWRSDGSKPEQILDNEESGDIAWSPNSLYLAMMKSRSIDHIATVEVFDTKGKILHELQMQVWDVAWLSWFTDNVLEIHTRYTLSFYEVQSGQFLCSWTSMPEGNGIFHQRPQGSPDGRWIFIDQGQKPFTSTLNANRQIIQKEYSLYDVVRKKWIPLIEHVGNYLAYAGWDSTSSKLYIVSRPAEPVSTNAPATPFGILTFDVNSQKFELVFANALQIDWNSDRSWAFIVFAEPGKEGKKPLFGSLWKVGESKLYGHWRISNDSVYQDPAIESVFSAYSGPIPVAWSHDGKRVAVSDRLGRVSLYDIYGSELMLTDKVQGRGDGGSLRWSPDDMHLLIESGNQGWIVKVPSP